MASTSFDGLARFARALVDARFDSSDAVFWGAVLLGITCGVLGSFIVLRRQSLLGDAIGHAVLPGVCIGFLAAGSRHPLALLAGAMVAGLASAGLISLLQRTTRLKTGECMGVVFTGFYAIGVVLLKIIEQRGGGGKAGLSKFLFGQIAGIGTADVVAMAVVAALTLGTVVLFWRILKTSSFDEGFAHALGWNVALIQHGMTVLLTAVIVVAIQAVGVVLVAAMLVTPAAAAYLWTDRLHRMVAISAVIGVVAGVGGAVVSVADEALPTGAMMVLCAAGLFAVSFLLSPRHGVLPRLARVWRRRRRTSAENLLRTMYLLMERRGGSDRRFGVSDIAGVRQEHPATVQRMARLATSLGWIERDSRDPLVLSEAGLAEARRIVRNHRLWELFLTREANLAADHVHADAERIEHVLPADVVRKLEAMLEHPSADPHGRQIPT
jgi:manganese/zinc/iron transport system permease protein